jgi:uncharacterized protein YkwD
MTNKKIKNHHRSIAFTIILSAFHYFQGNLLFAQNMVQNESIESLQQSVFEYVNQYRKTKRLPPLQMLSLISQEAIRHSQNMSNGRTSFGHDGFKERTGRVMSQIQNSNAAAENVAFGKMSAQEVVSRWIDSPGHRENIEGNYNLTGVGIVRARNGYLYFTQIFIHQKSGNL